MSEVSDENLLLMDSSIHNISQFLSSNQFNGFLRKLSNPGLFPVKKNRYSSLFIVFSLNPILLAIKKLNINLCSSKIDLEHCVKIYFVRLSTN